MIYKVQSPSEAPFTWVFIKDMTPRIDLPCSFDDCPQWWKNLVINTNGGNIDGRINRDEIFKRYHATAIKKHHKAGGVSHIEFESEEYKTWFLLNVYSDENFQ